MNYSNDKDQDENLYRRSIEMKHNYHNLTKIEKAEDTIKKATKINFRSNQVNKSSQIRKIEAE